MRGVRQARLAAFFLLFLLVSLVLAAMPLPAQGANRAKLKPGLFLVASRGMRDPRFAKSVVLILRYEDAGTLGLIINQPTEVLLADLMPEVKELKDRGDRVYLGGPVEKDGMMFLLRSDSPPADAHHIFADVYVGAGRTRFDEVIVQAGARFRSYVGNAGWAPGQLESELKREDWQVLPGDVDVVFSDAPADIWEKLIKKTEVRFANFPLPPGELRRPHSGS